MLQRHISGIDKLISAFDNGLRTLIGNTNIANRPSPAHTISKDADNHLSHQEKVYSARLMRINHSGEICAQALYQGQALTARQTHIQDELLKASAEENDHLIWCKTRAKELGGRTSRLSPFWYLSSLGIGATAGLLGDKWSLGFLAETERQVVKHLDKHLNRLPYTDKKSRCIIEQMKQDEQQHATTATDAGGRELPRPIKKMMRLMSKVMTTTTYWI